MMLHSWHHQHVGGQLKWVVFLQFARNCEAQKKAALDQKSKIAIFCKSGQKFLPQTHLNLDSEIPKMSQISTEPLIFLNFLEFGKKSWFENVDWKSIPNCRVQNSDSTSFWHWIFWNGGNLSRGINHCKPCWSKFVKLCSAPSSLPLVVASGHCFVWQMLCALLFNGTIN